MAEMTGTAGNPILNLGIEGPQDVVMVRQRARQLSAMLGFSQQEQVRIATAVSEVARCVCLRVYGGRAVFALVQAGGRRELVMTIRDNGGAERMAPASGGEPDGAGKQFDTAIITARRLMDGCDVSYQLDHAVTVSMRKALQAGQQVDAAHLGEVGAQLAASPVANSFSEAQQQNHELATALAELRERQDDLLALTRELEDTNRGVVALYAEIEEKAERIRHADEMKSRFLSNTSHELRTPLSSIRALAQLLLDRMDGDLSVEQERQVRFIASAANDLSNLVNDLLDLAKIEAGKVDISMQPIDIGNLFSALKGMLRPLAQKPAVELVFTLPSAPASFVSDEGKVAQILRNFISNALKFTEAGQVELALAPHPDPALICFAVSDTGIGIIPQHLHLIFEEFSQIEHPLQRGAKGTGLGLPLCRKLASLLGGQVEVRSSAGVGSTFTLVLPRSPASSFSTPPSTPPTSHAAA
jgi:signal transduction histidine kinase